MSVLIYPAFCCFSLWFSVLSKLWHFHKSVRKWMIFWSGAHVKERTTTMTITTRLHSPSHRERTKRMVTGPYSFDPFSQLPCVLKSVVLTRILLHTCPYLENSLKEKRFTFKTFTHPNLKLKWNLILSVLWTACPLHCSQTPRFSWCSPYLKPSRNPQLASLCLSTTKNQADCFVRKPASLNIGKVFWLFYGKLLVLSPLSVHMSCWVR